MKYSFVILAIFSLGSFYAQDLSSPGEIALETTIEKIGDYAQFAPAAASLIAVIIHNDEAGTWQYAKASAANLALTWTLKYAINKPRPEGRLDGYAFPSGHTSHAFQGAAFLLRRYGWAYGIPAYAVAGFVAFSRLEGLNDRHDGWDVLGGIIVGVGSTYLFTTPYQKDHFQLSFKGGDGDYLLGIVYKF